MASNDLYLLLAENCYTETVAEKVTLLPEIKGYLVYGCRPHVSISMSVFPERNNEYDPNAMLVKMPSLETLSPEQRQLTTRPADRQRPAQMVQDVAGKVIGHVRANI